MDFTKNNKLNQSVMKDGRIKTHFVVWDKKVPSETGLEKFQKVIEKKYNKKFESYWDLHEWSIKNFPEFWKEIWNFFDIIASKPYEEVFKKLGPKITDNDWFCGAAFNIAENFLRIRNNSTAVSYTDEFDNKLEITFAEVFEEVKIYASAFRRNGLSKGDRIGGHISNIKEAVFAFFAALSIGAIWSPASPYLGSRALLSTMKVIDPKFLLVVDHFFYDEEEFFPIENLSLLKEDLPNLEKIIIVRDAANSKRKIPCIPKGVLLEDFLESGRTPNGSVPDLIFEQLSPNHPALINFTSGTTGIPKAVVHSHVAFIGFLREFVLHLNLKAGDVICNYSPPGWAPWSYSLPSLALGVKQFLFNGSPTHRRKDQTFWDRLSENKVTYVYVASCDINDMQLMNIVPGPNTNLDSLKIITMCASPPLLKDYRFLLNKVKKDMYVGSMYVSTELVATISGINLKMPAFACESQAPGLGVDLRCFNSEGNAVVDQRGEMVIATPTPCFPIYLWGENSDEKMLESYFRKYGTGVWCQNDEGYFNSETKGFSVIGRSDNILKQYGQTMSPDDIYIAIDEIKELKDFICVCQDSVCDDARNILFIQLKEGCAFTIEVKEKIKKSIQQELSASCIPEVIKEVPGIPRNINNKRMESLVKKIVMTNTIPEVTNIKNPDCLKYFCDIPEIVNYK